MKSLQEMYDEILSVAKPAGYEVLIVDKTILVRKATKKPRPSLFDDETKDWHTWKPTDVDYDRGKGSG